MKGLKTHVFLFSRRFVQHGQHTYKESYLIAWRATRYPRTSTEYTRIWSTQSKVVRPTWSASEMRSVIHACDSAVVPALGAALVLKCLNSNVWLLVLCGRFKKNRIYLKDLLNFICNSTNAMVPVKKSFFYLLLTGKIIWSEK